MRAFTRHIAWLLVLIFAFLGAEKVNFGMEVSPCDQQGVYCPIANLYVYQPGLRQNTGDNNCGANQIDLNNSTMQIICETFFLNNELHLNEISEVFHSFTKEYFYKQVIHSTPYITLVDPPPMC